MSQSDLDLLLNFLIVASIILSMYITSRRISKNSAGKYFVQVFSLTVSLATVAFLSGCETVRIARYFNPGAAVIHFCTALFFGMFAFLLCITTVQAFSQLVNSVVSKRKKQSELQNQHLIQ